MNTGNHSHNHTVQTPHGAAITIAPGVDAAGALVISIDPSGMITRNYRVSEANAYAAAVAHQISERVKVHYENVVPKITVGYDTPPHNIKPVAITLNNLTPSEELISALGTMINAVIVDVGKPQEHHPNGLSAERVHTRGW